MKLILIILLVLSSLLSLVDANASSNKTLIRQYRLFKEKSGCKFTITSSRRSVSKNKAVGGTKNSYHLKGMAYDIIPLSSCTKSYYKLGLIARNFFNGVIVYEDHIHVDVGDRKYYDIKLNSTENIYLYGDVNELMYASFVTLVDYSNTKEHTIIINSLGGRVGLGFIIIDYMKIKQIQGHTFNCIVNGLAISMAATILQACDLRIGINNSAFMQHKSRPYSWLSIQFDKIRFKLTLLRLKFNKKYFTDYYILPERVFGVEEALSIGYIDQVIL